MILAFILLAYGFVSLAASMLLLYRGPVSSSGYGTGAAWCSALLFMFCHLMLVILALYHLVHQVSYVWFIGCLVLILFSRWLNGRILFGQNHWLHYAIIAFIFTLSILLDWLI